MVVSYITPFQFINSPSGLEFQSLVSNMSRLSTNSVSGQTFINILPPGLTTTLNIYDQISIFDGSNSEVVSVTVSIDTLGVETIQCTALLYNHAVGTPICADGVSGSLAQSIFSASQYLETICRQSLFLTSYTGELLTMPTMRASIDNHYVLHFRPRHWPIQNLTALSITQIPNFSINYDPTQVIIDSDKQICVMPNMLPLPFQGSGQAPYPIWSVMSNLVFAQLNINYQSGFASMPMDVVEACILLTSDILAKRMNPYGAPELKSGQRQIIANIKSETTGESLLFKRAKAILDNYTMQSF